MVVTMSTKSNSGTENGSVSATFRKTRMPFLSALRAIFSDGSTPNVIPNGAAN